MLGGAPDALYLREPMTQGNMTLGAATRAVLDVTPDNPPPTYACLAQAAFSGLPLFHQGIVWNRKQWALSTLWKRRVVIKEVNPLACEWLGEQFRPRILFLVRHPAGVANSYWQLGWLKPELEEVFDGRLADGPLRPWRQHLKTSGDFWHDQGVRQGAVLRLALDYLPSYPDCRVVLYEELCEDPVQSPPHLFAFAGLTWNPHTEAHVRKLASGGNPTSPYDVQRDSRATMWAWKKHATLGDIQRLRKAYGLFELSFYRDDELWRLS